MTRYTPSAGTAWAGDSAQIVLLRLEDLAAPPLVLDRAASAIWLALVQGWSSVEEVADAVATSFGTTADVVHHDVAVLVTELRDLGVVETPTGFAE